VNATYYENVKTLQAFTAKPTGYSAGWMESVWHHEAFLCATEGHYLRALPVDSFGYRNASMDIEDTRAQAPLDRVLGQARKATRVEVSLDRQEVTLFVKALEGIEKAWLKEHGTKEEKTTGPVLVLREHPWADCMLLQASRHRQQGYGVTLAASFLGEVPRFGFNPKFLQLILNSMKGKVILGIQDESSAVWISTDQEDDGFALLMPVRLRDHIEEGE